ncbi:response regulator transcription factor [Flavivirga rizhaonensis]|uniref:Response regulator transcription factor n=1 Tax=Flavivirga rizhaonensis TaxID=2559571 RepID=A0A4S1DW29_9FLAO|nr:response regulator transcription factor [Flavivirga rizhaonensis]TGV02219.1 response regulator transcription factor [Flavivirga rizhaonensis]
MNKILVFIFLTLICIEAKAQTNISGYITSSDSLTDKQQVFLSTKNTNLSEEPNIIASTQVDKNGFFNINYELSNEDKLYTLFINNKKKVAKSFILSNNDSLIFQKSDTSFSVYTNTNSIDKEWQKFKKFIEKQDAKSKNQTIYLNEIRNYAKDSLKILAIKLIGVKELKNKNLLEKDISLNPKYYTSLLGELKLSEIDASEYDFLEKELVFYHLKTTENKYSISKLINFILGFLLLISAVYLFSLKMTKTKKENQELSKQELNVKKLILEGKSNKDIADNLFISLSTVKTHITNIYNKLNVSNRAELIAKFKN